MKFPVFCMRDNKVGFMSPFVEQTAEAAKRGFAYALSNRDGVMSFAPADYDLFQIAEFDTESGAMTPVWPVELVISGSGVEVK